MCEAAPVDEGAPEPDALGEDDVPFSASLPPLPATEEGDTLFCASEEAFLYAANVLGPDLGGLMTPTIPDWQCLAWEQ